MTLVYTFTGEHKIQILSVFVDTLDQNHNAY